MEYDVVVVGSGVAGALTAAGLAGKGKILILEAGPVNESRARMMKRHLSAPIQIINAPYTDHDEAPRPKVLEPDGYYVQKGPDLFNAAYERRVGGTTWHWLGTVPRLLPEDFRMQSRFGHALDWPLTYDDLKPWYAAAEKELHVAGDDACDLGSPRSGGYPHKPIKLSYLDRHVAGKVEGSSFDGIGLRVEPTPQARHPERCQGSAHCIPLCPMGAKYEAIQHVDRAEKAGVELRARSIVDRLEVDEDGRIGAVQYLDWDGNRHRVKSRFVVLAAHGIETVKILLMSQSERTPRGVANSSDQVGRNLMDHPIHLSWGLCREPVHPYRGPLITSGIEAFRRGPLRQERAAFRTEIGNDGWTWPTGGPMASASALIDRKLYGKALQDTLRQRAQRHIRLSSLAEQLPNPENRVVLSKEHHDKMGLPRPEIHYHLDDYTRKGLARANAVHRLIFERVGATEVQDHEIIFSAGHIMGTYRMGTNPKTSVVNRDLRAHDHPNLYLLGSGVFPTGGTANPTLTIAALALRAADHLRSRLG